MPSVGDIVRVNACGTYLGQDACNVIYLVVGVWTGNVTLESALAQYATEWANRFKTIQHNEFSWVKFTLDNVTNPAEGAEFVPDPPIEGDKSGEAMPPFVSLSFRMNRGNRLTRNGYKRIAGLAEGDVTEGLFILGAGANAASVSAIETFLTQPFGDGDFIFDSVIVGRDEDGAPDLGRINFPTSTQVQVAVTTQNTRKFGRGS